MLVDTSVWIDFFNGHHSPEADRLNRAIAEGEPIALMGVVITEILAGLKNDTEADRIADLLTAFDPVAEFGALDYMEAARIFRHCRTQGRTIRSMTDCLIARSCLRDQRPPCSARIETSTPLRSVSPCPAFCLTIDPAGWVNPPAVSVGA